MMRRFTAVAVFFAVVLVCANLFAASKPFRFGVIGDNRSGDRIYAKIVEAMMRHEPDFVINTGDVIPNPGNRAQWKNFWELSKPITCPYYLAPGNHDIDDHKSQRVWRDEVRLPGNETYYSWVRNNNLFVVLNTCDPDDYRKITGAQWAWLKKTLGSKRKYDHKFVIVHHPLYMWRGATHYGKSLDKYPALRDELHELFKASGVDIVFAGHEHTYRRMEKDGIKYIVTGGAGARLYSGYNNLMVVDVDGDFISVKVYDKEGAVRDRFMMGTVPLREGGTK
jgi:predicted phosphodiesterase